ncbi:putative 2-oxoglutarate-dependent dioxygenase [Capsicum chinense]|nr:putative 2-oxoglutarate-dependent dioxygenase [Capsicum chinense]
MASLFPLGKRSKALHVNILQELIYKKLLMCYTGTDLAYICAILLLDLSRKIMRGLCVALGGSADEMEGEIAGDPFWVLQTIGYTAASMLDEHDKADNVVGW